MAPQIIGVLLPIIISLGAFVMVIALRGMKHRERMNMIEKGLTVEDMEKMRDEDRSFRRGNPWSMAFVLIGAGIGLLSAIFVSKIGGSWLSDDEATGVYFALIGIGAGIGMLAAHGFDKRKDDSEL